MPLTPSERLALNQLNSKASVKKAKSNSNNNNNNNNNKNKKSMSSARQSTAAVAYNTTTKTNVPVYSGTNYLGTTITHKELLGGVYANSTGAALTAKYSLNPGVESSFPWLSGIADSYDEYRFTKLKFHYISRTSSTTPGSVLLAFDPDAADAVPESESDLASYADAVESSTWTNNTYTVNPKYLNKWLYNRSSIPGNNLDIKTYDIGNFYIMTVDSNIGLSVGKLWVEYTVQFRAPEKRTTFPIGQLISKPYDQTKTFISAVPLNSLAINYGNVTGGTGYRTYGTIKIQPSDPAGNIVTTGDTIYFYLDGLKENYVYMINYGLCGTGLSYFPGIIISSGATSTFTNATGSNSISGQFDKMSTNTSLVCGGYTIFKVDNGASKVIMYFNPLTVTSNNGISITVMEIGSKSLL